MIKNVHINFRDILLDEKLFENYLKISYKTSTGPKPLPIRFDKIDGLFRVRGGEFGYWVFFNHGLFDKWDEIFEIFETEYLISEIVGIINSINHNL